MNRPPPSKRPRSATPAPQQAALTPDEIAALDELLQRVPQPLQPLELSAVDGYLVGVLLQPRRVPPALWLRWVTDEEGRPLPARWSGAAALETLLRRRHAELDRLIGARQWFDPWVVQPEPPMPVPGAKAKTSAGGVPPVEAGDEEIEAESRLVQAAVQPWVLGFATACSIFPDLTEGRWAQEPELIEALAQIYQHLEAEDLEDAQALMLEIESLEPPSTMEEGVESLVRGSLLLADISRPRSA